MGMTVTYAPTSPYSQTSQISWTSLTYLDFWKCPIIQAKSTDIPYQVEHRFTHRPDLLSSQVYQTDKYWWVFARRNPDIIMDPIYDLVQGIIIFLPAQQSLPTGSST